MNYRLLSKQLGRVALLIGVFMGLCIAGAFGIFGFRYDIATITPFEQEGAAALLASVAISVVVGCGLLYWGRNSKGELYRKEAMAVVGLSWVLATVLGALPFYLAGCGRGPAIRLTTAAEPVLLYNLEDWSSFRFQKASWQHWHVKQSLSGEQFDFLSALVDRGAQGLAEDDLKAEVNERVLRSMVDEAYHNIFIAEIDVSARMTNVEQLFAQATINWENQSETPREVASRVVARANDVELNDAGKKQLLVALLESLQAEPVDGDEFRELVDAFRRLREQDAEWEAALLFPKEEGGNQSPRENHYRITWVPMDIADALFESQSGFSTTGATVISDLEDPEEVPHCLLLWRSTTHFLGGLGIIVLFVVILGQGSAGKALMRAEMPGPTKEGSTPRMQHTAWLFAGIYAALNAVLTVLLIPLGLSPFDAICHAFGTMATGGFSTYNASLGHFHSATIEYVVTFFMILAGTNFTLLYLLLLRQPKALFKDLEWRTYMSIIAGVTVLIMCFGLYYGDFVDWIQALRYGLFQVVAIITTTGYGTNDFDQWNSFGRGVLLLLMFVGGCAGSTGGGMKVIRHIMFWQILKLEVERAYRPSVVRPLRIGGRVVEDQGLRSNILVYFGLILFIFVGSWLFVVTWEPDATWGGIRIDHKLIDSASGIAATLNNIGPGLGTVGATQNYGHFSGASKLLFVLLMMIGRLEIFAILVLFVPAFWRNR